LKNPKSEYRNSKQIQNSNFSKLQTIVAFDDLVIFDVVLDICIWSL